MASNWKHSIRLLFWLGVLVACHISAATTPNDKGLSGRFGDEAGCIAIFDEETSHWEFGNEGRARQRFSPCSTYKIPHSVIALECGVVADAGTTIAWNGVMNSRPETNRDHNLRSAFQLSVVWYYQEVARRVGAERMKDWLRRLDYGNQDISGGLTTFWLGSTLEISAVEQVEFLRRLQAGTLAASARSQEITREIMAADSGDGIRLYGKTGTRGTADGGTDLGWYVGWVEARGRGPLFFAANMSGKGMSGAKVRDLVRGLLEERKLAPPVGR